jgi:hypothetical protein
MSDALRTLAVIFEVDTGKASQAVRSLDATVNKGIATLGNFAEAFIGSAMVKGFTGFIEGQIAAAKEVRVTSEKLGVGVDQLESFQFAAADAGVTAEGAANGLRFLNKNLGEAIAGNADAAKTFADLGIDLAGVKDGSKNAADVLPQLADKFAAAGSHAEKTALSMKIFGRQGAGLIPLLDGGSESLQKMRERFEDLGGGMDDNFIAKAKEAGRALGGMDVGIEALKRSISVQLMPYATAFGEKMQGVIKYVQGFAKETNIAKEGAALFGIAAGAAGLKAAYGFGKFFGVFKGGGLLKNLLSMGWIGVLVAGVAALGVVLEDLYVGMNGGQSAIRDMLESANGAAATDELFKQLKETVDSVGASFDGMKPALGSVLAQLGQMVMSPEFIASVEYVIRLLGSFAALAVGAARAAGNLAKFAANVVGGKLTDADKNLGDAGKAVDQAGDAVLGDKGFFGKNAFEPKQIHQPTPVLDPSSDPSSPYYYDRGNGGGGAPAQVTQNATVNVTLQGGVNTEADAQKIAAIVKDEMQSQYQDAHGALARGPSK